MGGSVSFEEALAARLSLFKPSLSQDFLEKRPLKYVCCFFVLLFFELKVCGLLDHAILSVGI
uniref:Uncharacterized protein n=1 Tax=Rhizophora mucronata TaxID=61149 RepID=A0A2P2J0A0_RHIMU